jgi:mRNA-degrading endonuclease toxin of MazEF toxin-antitoxin module
MIRRTVLEDGWRGDDADELIKAVLRRRDELNRAGGKRCVVCHVTKSLSAFEIDADEHDGLARRCVDCEV